MRWYTRWLLFLFLFLIAHSAFAQISFEQFIDPSPYPDTLLELGVTQIGSSSIELDGAKPHSTPTITSKHHNVTLNWSFTEETEISLSYQKRENIVDLGAINDLAIQHQYSTLPDQLHETAIEASTEFPFKTGSFTLDLEVSNSADQWTFFEGSNETTLTLVYTLDDSILTTSSWYLGAMVSQDQEETEWFPVLGYSQDVDESRWSLAVNLPYDYALATFIADKISWHIEGEVEENYYRLSDSALGKDAYLYLHQIRHETKVRYHSDKWLLWGLGVGIQTNRTIKLYDNDDASIAEFALANAPLFLFELSLYEGSPYW